MSQQDRTLHSASLCAVKISARLCIARFSPLGMALHRADKVTAQGRTLRMAGLYATLFFAKGLAFGRAGNAQGNA